MNNEPQKNKNPYERVNPYEKTAPAVEHCSNELVGESTADAEAEKNRFFTQANDLEGNEISHESDRAINFDNTDSNNSFYNNSNVVYEQINAYDTSDEQPKAGRGFSIASLVLSIASLACCGGFIASIIAIIFSCIARKRGDRSGMTTAGLVIGIVSTVIWVFVFVFAIASVILASMFAIEYDMII